MAELAFIRSDHYVSVLREVADSARIPPHGRAWTLSVYCHPDYSWKASVLGASRDTPKDHIIWEMGSYYLARPPLHLWNEVTIVWFGRESLRAAHAFAWRSAQQLLSADPRVIFAIAEREPNLDLMLGTCSLSLMASAEYVCGVKGKLGITQPAPDVRLLPYVHWQNGHRKIYARWVRQDVGPNDFLVFVQPRSQPF